MSQEIYINGIGFVGAQAIFPREKTICSSFNTFSTPILDCQFSEYQKYIQKGAMRRMSSSVKMGSVAAKKALSDAKIELPDAIITGTGMGCKEDSDIFLANLLAQKEELLTPTKFIQSTHNTVGGQIALQLQTKVYNSTFVQGAASFESAILDADLSLFSENDEQNFLVGGIDEISKTTIDLHRLNGQIKKEAEVLNENLLAYKTSGSIAGEGASFFVISNQKNEQTYCKIKAIKIFNSLAEEKLAKKLKDFLKVNNLAEQEIDLLILGKNGDVNFDFYYDDLQRNFPEETPQLYYKHLIGEFYTASGFANALGAHILKEQQIPKKCVLNSTYKNPKSINRILLYNQYQGRDHSFIILEKC
ncbi:beta-ketoacyl-[acyl-carrier-protein] synthase family protein [Mesonia aquimarina]|uniref:3-oxoacyl-ACP synthase n=1 Tax=Mesonia aquimarina TaxID=1504967 RepID=UPI000EF60E8D|nr:3-oxoacyl-ACP synthase [Mesonia aquimarina]